MDTLVSNVIGCDDTIDTNSPSKILLEEGNYDFVVDKLERSNYPGSAKLPACDVADLVLSIIIPEGTVLVKTKLYLCMSLKWQLVSFFVCIGLLKQGEAKPIPWDKVVGARGRAHIGQHSFIGRDGHEHTSNEVIEFLKPDESKNDSAPATSYNQSNDMVEDDAEYLVEEDEYNPFEDDADDTDYSDFSPF